MPENIIKIPLFKKVSACLALSFMLCACANRQGEHHSKLSPGVLKERAAQEQYDVEREPKDALLESRSEQTSVGPEAKPNLGLGLPSFELDALTLEALLVMNFASFHGDWSAAADNAITAATRSQDFRIARSAAQLALREANYPKAADASKIWLQLEPNNIDAQNTAIVSLIGSQQVEAATAVVAQQVGEHPIDDYIKQLAGLLVRQKNAEGAFEVIDDMVQKHPKSAQVLVSAAFVAQSFEKYAAAEVWVDRALSLKPGWDVAASLNTVLLAEQNKFDERTAFIDLFLRDFPKSVTMRIDRAADLGRAKRYQQAYELMLEILVDAPNDVKALQYAAVLARQLGNTKQSGAHLRRALRVEPGNDEVRWSLARLALVDKKYVTAKRLFDDIKKEDFYIIAQIQVANIDSKKNGIQDALSTLRALQPRTEKEYLQVATARHYILMEAGEYGEAFSFVNEALVYLPDNVELLYARSLVAAELGEIGIAETDLVTIIAQQPQNANALNALGYTLADQTTRYEEAKALIVSALALKPNAAHILDSMGWVLYRLNDYDAAIGYLKKAYQASQEPEIAAHLIEVLWQSEAKERAKEVLRESLSEQGDNPALIELIERYDIQLKARGQDNES